jgi:hypothetical protein
MAGPALQWYGGQNLPSSTAGKAVVVVRLGASYSFIIAWHVEITAKLCIIYVLHYLHHAHLQASMQWGPTETVSPLTSDAPKVLTSAHTVAMLAQLARTGSLGWDLLGAAMAARAQVCGAQPPIPTIRQQLPLLKASRQMIWQSLSWS